MSDSEYICPSCRALDGSWCYHSPEVWELATAFARWAYPDDLSVTNIEAFLEDAESVIEYVGPSPWTVDELPIPRFKHDPPMSHAYILTSPTGRHLLAVDAEQERMANQCVVPAQYICTLPGEAP